LNAIFLGIIGEYIGVIYKNMKKGSLTITEYEIDSQKINKKTFEKYREEKV